MPRPNFFNLPLICLLILLTNACIYQRPDILAPEPECETTNVSYAQVVVPILKSNCYRCHDQKTKTAGIVLEGYAELKPFATSGILLGVIKHDKGFSAMPKDAPKLIDCQINQIQSWVNAGSLNN